MTLSLQALTNVLEKGCDPNYRGEEDRQRTLLHLAICEALQLKKLDKVRLLLKHKANPNLPDKSKDERTPLREAVDDGNISVARLLLRHGADPNLQSMHGATVLHGAVIKDKVEMVQLLLIHKANVSVTDRHDRPPIFFARSRIVCDVLVDHGADVLHVSEARGECSLHIAAANGAREAALFFLQSGVPIDSVDAKRYTALHKAALANHSNLVQLLLDWGADSSLTTKRGQTAVDIADAHKHGDLAFYLYCRHTGSNKVPLREQLQNPLLLVTVGIMGSAIFNGRALIYDVFLDLMGW
eukprot:GEMP01045837.1.p1 GENE.GEMP01045837.1~~GEMP01045837.1.p1  ORF type:complete len:298 (+),score=79.06 GEMP01045837.1:182-1075(+)